MERVLALLLCLRAVSSPEDISELKDLLDRRGAGDYLLAFTSPTCSHCAVFKGILRDVVQDKSLPFLFHISCDTEQQLCYRMNIASVPRLLLYKSGKIYTQPLPYSYESIREFALQGHHSLEAGPVPDVSPGTLQDALTGFRIIFAQANTLFRRGNVLVKVLIVLIVTTILSFVALFIACIARLVILLRRTPPPKLKIE